MPRWRADSHAGKYELYYLTPDNKLTAVTVSGAGGTFVTGTPEALFQTHIAPAVNRQKRSAK